MVKRWRGYGKVIIKVPWLFGTKVHRIDLTITDLTVKWGTGRVLLGVEIDRKIHSITATGALQTTADRISYQKKLAIPPGLIRGQPLEAKATSLYVAVQEQGAAAYLEQGIGLSFTGWERLFPTGDFPPVEQSLLILGKKVIARDSYLHTETLTWPEMTGDAPPVETALGGVEFTLTPHGIHFQGELELIFAERPRKTHRLSVLIPQKIPAGAELTGQAELTNLTFLDGGRVLLTVKLDWCLLQEKPLPVKVAPVGEGQPFLLWRLRQRKNHRWTGTFHLKLPEKAKLIEEVNVTGVKGWIVQEDKGLMCMGQITLDLFYINHKDQEKCEQLRIPWEEWVATPPHSGTPLPRRGKRTYRLEVERVKADPIGFTNGKELTLLLQLENVVMEVEREKATFPIPTVGKETVTILAEKLISEETIEYYVEIPVTTPADFGESHRLWWRKGRERGETVSGGVLIRVEPSLIWQYRNEDRQIKVVEVKPILEWLHPSPLVSRGQQAHVEVEAIGLELQRENRDSFRIQLLLSGRLTVTTEEVRTVELSGQPDPVAVPILPKKKRSVLKWEEKLPYAAQQIQTVHFFFGPFRRIKTDNLFLLEGEVRGEITYLGKDGVERHHRLKKELWASLPSEYSRVPVLIPVLTGWKCSPLPEWNWEKGGVWCEISLDLLAFTSEQN